MTNQNLAPKVPSHNDLISILNNVSFGLVRCDRNGEILPGYSYSLRKIFEVNEDTEMVGTRLTDLLCLSERDASLFMSSYEDIFEDDLFAELSATNISKTYEVDKKHLNLKATPIASAESTDTDSVLFVVEDATSTIAAQQETKELKSILNLIRNKSAFQGIISELTGFCKKHKEEFHSKEIQRLIRAKLHNWKGSLSFLDLQHFVNDVHAVEDFEPIEKAHLVMLSENFQEFLEKHSSYINFKFSDEHLQEFRVVASQLHTFADKVRKTSPKASKAIGLVEEFFDEITSVALSELLNEIEKMVQRIANDLEKNLKFELKSHNALIPLRYHEMIRGCLHIVRNAVYHGIEKPEIRLASGKPEAGILSVEYVQTPGHWGIEISDDGAGINLERLKQKALENNIVQPEKLKKMKDGEIYQLVFEDNLSTSDVTTKIAGRGVGLAGLKAEVLAAGGQIKVFNSEGKGCKFLIWIPKKVVAG